MIFAGFHEHAIDKKNRLAIPAKFRSGLDPERDGSQFVIIPGQPPDRLWLYPEKWFEEMVAQAGTELIPDDDRLRFDQGLLPPGHLC
jgi:DNA-binding transcriptional regulator/RsmH inhibitor MraZ